MSHGRGPSPQEGRATDERGPAPQEGRGRATDERARLFVALELPGAVHDALGSWRDNALEASHDLRLIERAYLHVTLCFLGWQAIGAADAIGTACHGVREAGPLELELGQATWLPARRPRVLAVELVDLDGRLGALQAALSGALEQGGWYRREKRPFLPHVTVARVRRGGRVEPWQLKAPPGLAFAAEQLTLYRSHLAPAGASYEPLARIGLAGSRG